jgi:hypothetical protein
VSGEQGTPRFPQEVAALRPPGAFGKRNSQEEVYKEEDLTISVLDPRAAAATTLHLFAPPALVHDPDLGHDLAARLDAGSQAFEGVAHRALGSQLGTPRVQKITGENDFFLDRGRTSPYHHVLFPSVSRKRFFTIHHLPHAGKVRSVDTAKNPVG